MNYRNNTRKAENERYRQEHHRQHVRIYRGTNLWHYGSNPCSHNSLDCCVFIILVLSAYKLPITRL